MELAKIHIDRNLYGDKYKFINIKIISFDPANKQVQDGNQLFNHASWRSLLKQRGRQIRVLQEH